MRKLAVILLGLAALLSAPASAGAEFGLEGLEVTFSKDEAGNVAEAAGTHPYAWTQAVAFETVPDPELGFEAPDSSPRSLFITAPTGLAAAPTATPRCSTLDFLVEACPASTQLGVNEVTYSDPETTESVPVYNLAAPPGVAAKLGFWVAGFVPVTVEGSVNPDPPYNIVGSLRNVSQALPVYRSVTTLWGNPPGAERPFLTMPRACEGPLQTRFRADSWERPGVFDEPPPALSAQMGFCEKLGLAAEVSARPTSRAAEAPAGLDFDLDIDDPGIADPGGTAYSDIKRAAVTFPEGITLNPSQAEGLAVCSEAALARETAFSGPGEGCPEASKVGRVEAQTPLLEDEVLRGDLYVAEPYENRFGTLIAVYIVVRDPGLGIVVKLAGKVEADPESGRLRAIFGAPGNELPQFPLSRVGVRLSEGARSPLVTPPACGSYEIEVELTPWAGGSPQRSTPDFRITEGVGGGPCPPRGASPFEPGFQAGTQSNRAGGFSPFHLRLTRRDGDQDLTRFDAVLPPGLLARLAGVPWCPDAAIARAEGRDGEAELARPSCPEASRIGTVMGGAGVGSQLTYVPGKVYLAGPVAGAPLSVVGIVPAVAGPFDVGTIVVRQALDLDPVTGEARVDGAASDPIPHILAGIPLRVRDIQVSIDRPAFTLNPTSCAEMATRAGIWGGGSHPFSVADDFPVLRSARFQAAGCAALGFKPKLAVKLKGGVRRGAFPALRAHYRPRAGDANLSRLSLALPSSAFVEQGHFRTICTRVQFAAGPGHGALCPAGSVYGRARVWTPLLDEPLQGPVILRSSDNNLPDAVFALRGLVEIEVAVRIDSVGGRLRATVQGAPDAPVSRAIVDMQGGRKGLFVNSRHLCFKPKRNRARVNLLGQNGRPARSRPVVRASGCRKARGASRPAGLGRASAAR
jgi:hypothetical protein